MKDLIVAGIDYSMTSPAMVKHHGSEWSIKNCKFYYLTDKKVAEPKDDRFVRKLYPTGYSSDTERFTKLALFFSDNFGDVDYGYIEGYAMGASGRLATIGENTGFLKSAIYSNHSKSLNYPSPNEIKKFATGKGNATKEKMYEAFVAENPDVDIHDIIGISKTFKKKDGLNLETVSDIIDAYFICKLGFETETKKDK